MREVKPTQKPVPSSDIKDLFFNSGLLDIWATSLETKYIDRFGNCHLTAAGMEWLFKELVEKFKIDMNTAIVAAGYITIDSFQQGADLPNNELTQRNHILRDETTGEYYRWDGDLPKQVPAGSTPRSTGGIGKGNWVSVGDASLRSYIKSSSGAGLIGTSSGLTVQEIINRGTIYIDDLITSRDGDVDASAPINALLEQIRSMTDRRWIAKIVGTRGAKYRLDSMIDLRGVSGIEIDFGLATVIDNVQGRQTNGRSNPTFLSYNNKNTKIKNIIYEVSDTRDNSYKETRISSVVFWIGGQQFGNDVTTNSEVENFYATDSNFDGGIVAAIQGESRSVRLYNFNIVRGAWRFGVDVEWGRAPTDPAIDNSDENGRHPHNVTIESFNGESLNAMQGFLRTAGSYNVEFLNCTGLDVPAFIDVYGGDRGISRCNQSAIFTNCKSRIITPTLTPRNIVSIQILDTLEGVVMPEYIKFDSQVIFNNCEFSGIGNSSCVRFIGNKGSTVFNSCLISGGLFGLYAEKNNTVSYEQILSLTFNDCSFIKNNQHVVVSAIKGVVFNFCKYKNHTSTDTPIVIRGFADDTKFYSCLFNGKGTSGYLSIRSSINCLFQNNTFTGSGIMIDSTSRMLGSLNSSHSKLVSDSVSAKRVIGESSSGVRVIDSVSTRNIDFECVETGVVTSGLVILSSITNGNIGDKITFSGSNGGHLELQHSASNEPQVGSKLFMKSGKTTTYTAPLWCVSLVKLSDGWYEM
ncbi:hypothetical protein [Providencia rettgeri]|uniref:tail fiber/spike domain-containing protein n=1 Tax=Providencia rettgeri TaxID=587 RepID=UPI00205C5E70|nr:hypothetical protein [Providencia rettgeri]UPS64250.1 hypothetical protein M0M83_06895 [Providencia rettgeri]